MVKIKLAVIRSARAKDGTYKIRIAIGHKSETHYIVTPYSVPSLANFKNGTIIGTPTAHHDNIKLRQLLTDYEERLERIPNPGDYSCGQLRDVLKRMIPRNPSVTLAQLIDELIRRNREEGRQTNVLTFVGGIVAQYLAPGMTAATMTPATVDAFGRALSGHGYANGTINAIMQQARRAVNIGIRDFGVKYDTHPFAYYKPLPRPYRDRDISVGDMRKIMRFETKVKRFAICRDALLLSYYLGGINYADLVEVDFGKARGVLDYVRKKTRRTSGTRVQIAIVPEAQEIINKYLQGGRVVYLPTYSQDSTKAYFGKNMREMAKAAGVADYEKVTYYTARKSFVQHGFDLGISLETLEYCLGHSTGGRMIYNYMRVMRKHADKAIARIVAQLTEETPSDGA